MKLSDAGIRSIKPSAKIHKISDKGSGPSRFPLALNCALGLPRSAGAIRKIRRVHLTAAADACGQGEARAYRGTAENGTDRCGSAGGGFPCPFRGGYLRHKISNNYYC